MGVPVTRLLKQLYERVDPIAEKAAKEMGATCERSCADCCSLLATMTLAEGILVAENILKRDSWKEWVPRLVSAAEEFCYVGITKGNYFDKKIPCVFLDQAKLCKIYEDRPSTCRYHYVVTDPKECSPDAKEGRTGVIDMLDFEKPVWGIGIDLGTQLGIALPIIGPIPLVVLACMLLIIPKNEDGAFLTHAIKDLPTPTVWVQEYAMDLIKEGEDVVPMTEEEFKAVKALIGEKQ